MMRHSLPLFLLCALLCAPALAGQMRRDDFRAARSNAASVVLFWDSEAGWRSQDGELERRLGEGIESAEALDLMNRAYREQLRGKEDSPRDKYKKVYREWPASLLAPEAHFQRAQLWLEDREYKKAFEELNTIIFRYPDYYGFGKVIDQQFEIATELREGKLRYFGLIPYRPTNQAIQYFEFVVSNAPYSHFAPRALMAIGRIYQERDEPMLAIDAFDRLVNFYPESELADDAYLEIAATYASLMNGPEYDQGATREAMSYYEDFLILYPDSPYVAEGEYGLDQMQDAYAKSKLVMGDFYYKHRNNITAANVFYNEAITTSPDSETAETARERLREIKEGKRYDTRVITRLTDVLLFRDQDPVQSEQVDAEYNQPGAKAPEPPASDEDES